MKCLLILSYLLSANLLARVQYSSGTAYNQYGRIVYKEKHTITYKDNQIITLETQYFDLKGKNFAYLKSDFTKNIGVPTYEFLDRRFGRADGTRLAPDARSVLVYGQQNKNEAKRSKDFPVTKDLITGQGLYAYLKTHLKELCIKKESTDIKFLIPMKRTYYDFRIKVKKLTTDKVKFRVEIDNFFARLIAPSLDITYDRNNANLLVFEGPSNILDEKEKMRKVKIVYEYPQDK